MISPRALQALLPILFALLRRRDPKDECRAVRLLPLSQSCRFLAYSCRACEFRSPALGVQRYSIALSKGAWRRVNGPTAASLDRIRRVAELRAELARKIAAHVRAPGERSTAVRGLTLYRPTTATACYAAEYETGLAVIVQGRKRVTLGRTTYVCDESAFLLTSVDVPLVSEGVTASEKAPLLALFLKLSMATAREVLGREEFKLRNGQSTFRTSPVGQTRCDLLEPCIRLLDLLDAPAEIPFFSPLIQREIIYRLLQYPQGDRLRAIARLDARSRGTARALAWLRANYMKPFRLDQLASVARMGISALHRHFRAVTALSPLQYQKQLRLTGARERMLVEGLDATQAALEVGYESTSQFTREYKRLFGEPPMRDVRARRQTRSRAMSRMLLEVRSCGAPRISRWTITSTRLGKRRDP
jgi:AraC-like DNA-binding protein